ncbi:MAG: ABC transporter ATP-binding protein [Firmicutes bacterium]|nr:ABC transporter ATP-binding protein [Bacillota bacterium]
MLTTPVCWLDHVSISRDGKKLLDDVSFVTRKGEHWALLGANGAGKTTLLQILMGYLWPTDGSVHVLGHTLGRVDVRELRKQIGFVSASMDARLEPGESALGIVLSGPSASWQLFEPVEDDMREQAVSWLARLGASGLEEQPYRALSQGERQKVLIARALMANPQILILDEPCNGLDFPSRESLLAAIDDIARSGDAPQLLYVTHYPDEIVPAITHAALLSQGQMVSAGDKQAVLQDQPLSRAFGLPVRVMWQDGYPIVRVARSVPVLQTEGSGR